jgi:hypothetical protein
MYIEFFDNGREQFVDFENVENAEGIWDQVTNEEGDMGVDEMKKKRVEELCTLLGFPDARPIIWNSYRAAGNAQNAWEVGDEAGRKKFDEGGEQMEPLCMLWHQLVGVASMAHKVFSAEERQECFGILLADEVGVGKTAQVMGFIALLQTIYQAEQKQKTRPALLGM